MCEPNIEKFQHRSQTVRNWVNEKEKIRKQTLKSPTRRLISQVNRKHIFLENTTCIFP